MQGGPSHVDTFDHKPRLQRDDGKPLPFAKPRVQFAETGNAARLALEVPAARAERDRGQRTVPARRRVRRRPLHHQLAARHQPRPTAVPCSKLHTGSDTFVRPSMGSWITYGLGTENQNLPGFITICPTLATAACSNWSSAFLPAVYQGTPLGNAGVPAERSPDPLHQEPHSSRRASAARSSTCSRS